MKRYAFCLALVSLGTGLMATPLPASAASPQAKKHCAEQWEAEKKAKSIPRGMSQAKYMRQCTANYAANTPPATDQGTDGQTPTGH